MRPAVVRLRTVVAGAALAALVGSLGQPVARAATPTPTEIQTLVVDALTVSRTKADAGVSSTNTFGQLPPSVLVERYDATTNRYRWQASNGRIRIEATDAVYDNWQGSKAQDAKAKKLAGRTPGTWIRISASDPRHGEDFNGIQHQLDLLFLSARPESSVPQTGSVTAGRDGSTVYALSWFSGRLTGSWTVNADGTVASMRSDDAGGAHPRATYTYAPQTVTLPTTTMGARLYDRATEAVRLPTTVKGLAKSVKRFSNEQPPATVKEVRKWARKWRDQHNRYNLLVAHTTKVRGGARIWVKNPFTGTVVSRRVVVVAGKAVVRR